MFRVEDKDGFLNLTYTGTRILNKYSLIYVLRGCINIEPTKTSIQIGSKAHIEDNLGQYINHSCDPNVRISRVNVVSIKEIKPGDSITFDYNNNEDYMSNPFVCNDCGKLIKGKLA